MQEEAIVHKNMPLFSVCVVTMNQRHLLNECLDSILAQDYPNIELVVCDDESSDFDPQEVQAYIDENKGQNVRNVVIFKQEKNVGTTRNCRKAVELSSGTYLKLQAGDDLFFSDTVLIDMARFFLDRNVRIICSRARGFYIGDNRKTKIRHEDDCYPAQADFDKIAGRSAKEQFNYIGTESWGRYVCAPAVFWKRAFYDEMGGFDTTYKYTEDWPMWLHVCNRGYSLTYIDTFTVWYRYGGISNAQLSNNLVFGKIHYEESIRMLQDIAMPVFRKDGNRPAMFRCWYAQNNLRLRILEEKDWYWMPLYRKVLVRIKYLPFYVAVGLLKYFEGHSYCKIKKELIVFAVAAMLLYFGLSLYPSWNNSLLFSVILWAALVVGAVKILWNVFTFAFRKLVVNSKFWRVNR